MSRTDFALRITDSAHLPLGSSATGHIASRSCHQPSGQLGLEGTLHSEWGSDSALCLRVGKAGSRAVKLLIWRSESGSFVSCQIPWSKCVPNLVLQMRRATSWDCYLGAIRINLDCQDLCAGCSIFQPPPPAPISSTAWFPVAGPCRFSCNPHGMRSE